jgi:hypothetical protein
MMHLFMAHGVDPLFGEAVNTPPLCHVSYVSDTIREDTCTESVLFTGHVSNMYLTLTLSVPWTEKYLGSCFLMQVGAVRCFGVRLRVIFPY